MISSSPAGRIPSFGVVAAAAVAGRYAGLLTHYVMEPDDDATGIPSRVEWTLDDAPGGRGPPNKQGGNGVGPAQPPPNIRTPRGGDHVTINQSQS